MNDKNQINRPKEGNKGYSPAQAIGILILLSAGVVLYEMINNKPELLKNPWIWLALAILLGSVTWKQLQVSTSHKRALAEFSSFCQQHQFKKAEWKKESVNMFPAIKQRFTITDTVKMNSRDYFYVGKLFGYETLITRGQVVSMNYTGTIGNYYLSFTMNLHHSVPSIYLSTNLLSFVIPRFVQKGKIEQDKLLRYFFDSSVNSQDKAKILEWYRDLSPRPIIITENHFVIILYPSSSIWSDESVINSAATKKQVEQIERLLYLLPNV